MSESRRPNITAVVIGIVLTMLLLFGLRYLAIRRGAAVSPDIPALNVIAPTENAAVDSPLVVRFSSSRPITLQPSGWGAGHFHLHARIDQAEHMPAAADIVRADSVYEWTLPAVRRGSFSVQLGWADMQHRELATGKTPPIWATVR